MQKLGIGDRATAAVLSKKHDGAGFGLDGKFHVVCHGADGAEKWQEPIDNLVTNEGLDYALGVSLVGTTPISAWFVGLTSGTPTVAAADTMSSHAGWTEITGYSQATRPALTLGSVSARSVTNSGSPSAYSVNATVTVGGCFVTSVSTKSGTSGTLFSVGAFTGGNRALVDGDTLSVTYTVTSSDV